MHKIQAFFPEKIKRNFEDAYPSSSTPPKEKLVGNTYDQSTINRKTLGVMQIAEIEG